MVTISHALINAAIAQRLGWDRARRIGFIWGAVAPDIPLALLVVGTFIYQQLLTSATAGETVRLMFQVLYFENPWWKGISDVLHAPMSIAVLWGVSAVLVRRRPWRGGLHAFFLGVLLHTAIDIPTHHNDGPLLLWPLEWRVRFYSPISFHDGEHFGRVFNVFETLLDLALLAYLLRPWWRLRRAGTPTPAAR